MNHTATMSQAASAPSGRGRWTTLNIALMVLGFVLFWPLGLAMLAYIIWGDEIGAKAAVLRERIHACTGARSGAANRAPDGLHSGPSGNAAFDEYRAEELRRIAEERRKLEAMRAEFEDFLAELRRTKDHEEFEGFMREFRNRSTGGGTDAT